MIAIELIELIELFDRNKVELFLFQIIEIDTTMENMLDKIINPFEIVHLHLLFVFIECIWIVWLLRVTRIIAEEISVLRKKDFDQKTVYWCVYLAIVLLFALYDVLISGMNFGFAITYLLLFYPIFLVVDYLTKYNGVKSFFMIMLIYML